MVTIKNQKKLKKIKNKIRLKGFNSIFAVQNIEMAKLYYSEFKKQMENHPERNLKIATIYSYSPNEDIDTFNDGENPENTEGLDKTVENFWKMLLKIIIICLEQIMTL